MFYALRLHDGEETRRGYSQTGRSNGASEQKESARITYATEDDHERVMEARDARNRWAPRIHADASTFGARVPLTCAGRVGRPSV